MLHALSILLLFLKEREGPINLQLNIILQVELSLATAIILTRNLQQLIHSINQNNSIWKKYRDTSPFSTCFHQIEFLVNAVWIWEPNCISIWKLKGEMLLIFFFLDSVIYRTILYAHVYTICQIVLAICQKLNLLALSHSNLMGTI